MCFHPQRPGATWPDTINNQAGGKTHLLACLSVTSMTPELHFLAKCNSKSKKITKQFKRCQPFPGILRWRPRQELQLNPNSRVVLRCGDNRKSTTMSRNHKVESSFVVLFFWATSHVQRRPSQLFHMFIENNNATRREGTPRS